jgi:hypothetical protein
MEAASYCTLLVSQDRAVVPSHAEVQADLESTDVERKISAVKKVPAARVSARARTHTGMTGLQGVPVLGRAHRRTPVQPPPPSAAVAAPPATSALRPRVRARLCPFRCLNSLSP